MAFFLNEECAVNEPLHFSQVTDEALAKVRKADSTEEETFCPGDLVEFNLRGQRCMGEYCRCDGDVAHVCVDGRCNLVDVSDLCKVELGRR